MHDLGSGRCHHHAQKTKNYLHLYSCDIYMYCFGFLEGVRAREEVTRCEVMRERS